MRELEKFVENMPMKEFALWWVAICFIFTVAGPYIRFLQTH